MSMISTTVERSSHAAGAEQGAIVAAMKRLLAAYITWRTEQSAIAVLHAMSDRELADIGLARSEVAGAVRTGAAQGRAPACEY